MANSRHLAKLNQGVKTWNAWRKKNPSIHPDLHMADLLGCPFKGYNLRDARLSLANLRQADLRGVDLTKAYLQGANLTETNMWGADLTEANLWQTQLRGADLTDANFEGVGLMETFFIDVDLSKVKNLQSCNHEGPCFLDHTTLARSSGRLPLPFLRGCGLSDKFIEYIPSIFSDEVFQFYTCFISYSTKDQAFAERLYNDLQGTGVRCWFAPEDMQGGKTLIDQIDSAIRLHDKLLLVLSEHSMASTWVKTELKRTLKAESQQGKRKLFPLGLADMKSIAAWECFDATIGEDLADTVREYFIPDFTNWETNVDYQKAFKRLLKDLKEEQPSKGQKAG